MYTDTHTQLLLAKGVKVDWWIVVSIYTLTKISALPLC